MNEWMNVFFSLDYCPVMFYMRNAINRIEIKYTGQYKLWTLYNKFYAKYRVALHIL